MIDTLHTRHASFVVHEDTGEDGFDQMIYNTGDVWVTIRHRDEINEICVLFPALLLKSKDVCSASAFLLTSCTWKGNHTCHGEVIYVSEIQIDRLWSKSYYTARSTLRES